MAPAAQSPLLTQPQDVYDLLGTEGVQLRLDDHQLATSQRVQLTAAAAAGDASVTVLPLVRPLLPGTVLEFDGAGLAAVVEVQTAGLARTGDTALAVAPLAQALPAYCVALDSGVNLALAARLVKGCQYGTSQVKLFCSPRYDTTLLAQNWSANYWATAIAARWVARRRGQMAPQSLDLMCEEAYEQLKQVRFGVLLLEDVPTRTSAWPFLSNVTVDTGYSVTKVRVEEQISELTPTLYPQYVDWNSALWVEW